MFQLFFYCLLFNRIMNNLMFFFSCLIFREESDIFYQVSSFLLMLSVPFGTLRIPTSDQSITKVSDDEGLNGHDDSSCVAYF